VPPVFVMHHGAGHSGLSYGMTAKRIRAMTNSECSILAYDCRGHGMLGCTEKRGHFLSVVVEDIQNLNLIQFSVNNRFYADIG
jgi:hypothetical protein